jgi:16S rRNA (uracil1498-N3)-methyltransferase
MIRVSVALAGVNAGELTIDGDEAHYLTRVRRVRAGEQLQLFDGEGRIAAATIRSLTSTTVVVEMQTPHIAPRILPHITAMIPLIKGDRFDYCLEKLVEVGVDEIIVWAADRAVVKLDATRVLTRLDKWRAAITAATRQAACAHEPTISGVIALSAAPLRGQTVFLHPLGEQHLSASSPTLTDDITVVSGPEGGFSPSEIEFLLGKNCHAVALGPRILRAETAPVVTVSLLRSRRNGVTTTC